MFRFSTLLHSFIGLTFLLTSCQQYDLSPEDSARAYTACGVNDPIKELAWLKELINQAEKGPDTFAMAGTLQLVNHQGQSYFVYQRYIMSCMACEVYTCQGEKLDILAKPELHMAIIEGMSEKNIIYRSPFN